jgi:indole-3-glycerol phosphate synthase/phosphoribosylanthranilate isomerase
VVLKNIVVYKNRLITEKLSEIKSYKDSLNPSSKDFLQALKKNQVAFICEIKLASPSQGLIRLDVDIGDVARIYAPFANAISVLADEKFFKGSLENVRRISQEQSIPVLCKDIVVSPWQIYEARFYGADAVLLMLSVLDDETYYQCEAIAQKLNMAVVCEVHSEEEMLRAQKLKPAIIGINNRNLKTLEIDLETTERLVPLAPKNSYLISESGFVNHEQIHRYKDSVNAFLVGTSLMRQERIDLALRELIFGRVKICGLSNAQDARLAYDAGAYYGGLNFSQGSPRQVSVEEARTIMTGAPLSYGGVFVNQPVDDVIKIARSLALDFVQLHGDEEKDYINQLRPDLPVDCAIWQAVRVKDQVSIKPNLKVDLLVFDKRSEQQYGGTGQVFDWNLLKDIGIKFALAGGIKPGNVSRAESLAPFVLDIASGVEEVNEPRKKSARLMHELFNNLRNEKEFYEK